jgi:hypothetical protein
LANRRDRDTTTGESILPVTSSFPSHVQSPQPQEDRYVLRSEYEELKATVGRLESIVAALTGTTGMATAPAQTSMFPSHSATSKGTPTSPVVTSAAPHALYTPVNSTYSASAAFAPPVASMRPGSSSPSSAGEASGMLKYLNLPHSGSGNSPTSIRSMSSSTSASADRMGAPLPDTRGATSASNPAPASRNTGFPVALGGADSGKTTSRYITSPARRLTAESSISHAISRGEEPRPATVRSSSSASTLSGAGHSHEVRSQSPMERVTSPARSRTPPHSSTSGNRKDSRLPAAPPPTYRAATLARIAPSPHPPAPGVLGRVDTEGIEKANQKVNWRELDATAAAPISSLISAHWNQRQRAEHAPSVKARKRPIESHGILHPSTKFVTTESSHQRDEGSDEDDQADQDDGRHHREGSACSSVDQLDSSTSTYSPPRDTEMLMKS